MRSVAVISGFVDRAAPTVRARPPRRPLPWWFAWLLALLTGSAAAHKSSDAYLLLDAAPNRLALRWDIALRDLDIALDLDADRDGRLSWGEVRTAWPRIVAYAADRLTIDGCPLTPGAEPPALERRNDGVYAVLHETAACTLPEPPVLRYRLLAEVDPTHRGIARIARPGQPIVLRMLDPAGAPDAPSGGPSPRSAAASGASAANDRSTSSPAAIDAAAVAASAHPPTRWQFLGEGVRHILGGYDHVLFLLCLLLPAVLRRTANGWRPVERLGQAIWPVVGIVSAFTLAHSLTLGLAALKLVSLPSSLIEPAIAVTIALAAIDNLWPVFPVRRVVVTFLFGLVHGFGFAGVLAELDLPTADFAWALLQFNLGLECGQLLIVAVAVSALYTLRNWRLYRAVVLRGGSVVALAIAAAWFVERVGNVSILPF